MVLKRAGILLVVIGAIGLFSCATSPSQKEAKYLRRGNDLMERREFGRALLEFRNAAQAMPRDAEALYRIALAAYAMGDVRTAAAALRKATELNPKHTAAQLKLSELMAASGNKALQQDAEKRLESLVANRPNDMEAVDSLAFAETELGKTDDAT